MHLTTARPSQLAGPPTSEPAESARSPLYGGDSVKMAAPGRIPRGGAIAAAELAEAALWGAAISASACPLILTKPETADRRRSVGTAGQAGCSPEMAVSEPGGSAAVSAMMRRGGLVVSCGRIGRQ